AYRPSTGLRVYLAGTLAAVVLLMTTTSTGLVEDLERTAKLAQVYGAYVWAYLLLVAALVVLLRQRAAEPVTAVACVDVQASISVTTVPSGTNGTGRPVRSTNVVAGSMPSK